mmetsp:Transcript_23976/g.94413  ORF Transcript_23976/g.94413 Transcript_23976/m.94413 type:complete len:136 (+) Transcript_23976:1648-2055(+)
MEMGPRDVEKGSVFCARRIGGPKFGLAVDENFEDNVDDVMDKIQQEMYSTAKNRLDELTKPVSSYEEMKAALDSGETGFFLAPWKEDDDNEDKIKEDCKATIRCYPMDSQEEAEDKLCFYSGEPATHMAIFARAY